MCWKPSKKSDRESMESRPRNLPGVTATEFAKIWKEFDIDDNGYIDGNELNAFFYELAKRLLKKEPTAEEHENIKRSFMSAYDKAKDGRISMNELAKMLLPEDEEFLLLFRRRIPLDSSVTFMQLWRKYDKNKSGFLDTKEIQNFIGDYVTAAGATVSSKKLKEYAKSIMKLFDRNGDNRLDLQDMARLVNVCDNFLLQFKIQDGSPAERRRDFEKIFSHYDQSQTGALEGAELDGFVKDMMELIRVSQQNPLLYRQEGCEGPLKVSELEVVKKELLSHADVNKDGVIQRTELAVMMGVRL